MTEPKMMSAIGLNAVWVSLDETHADPTTVAEIQDHIAALTQQAERYRAALEQIAKGEGPYSMDNHQFACNVIEESKRLANEALRGEGQ